jgi:ADP-heptose:LPS heptosyltransferase
MNSVIILSCWSRNTPNGQPSPKNYPFWPEVVRLLKLKGIKTVQVAVKGEKQVGADETLFDVSLADLTSLLNKSSTWIACDNFWPHFAAYHKKRGVAIFAKSDPNIFGHSQNINLLKHRRYLRANQFDYWNGVNLDKDSFVSPNEVVEQVVKLI